MSSVKSAFWVVGGVKPKLAQVQRPILFKEYTSRSQGKLKIKTTVLPEARENDGNQVAIDPNLASDWLREWHDLSWSITEK